MSKTKHSKKQIDYSECMICGCFISPRDQNIHVEVCHQNDSCQPTFNHSFIKDTTLHGLITKIDEKDIEHLPCSLKKSAVYLNLAAIKLCQLRIGDPVLVQTLNTMEVLTAWPSQNVNLLDIGLMIETCKKLKCKQGDKIKVCHMTGPHLAARIITLRTWEYHDFMTGEIFKNYLKSINDKMFYTAGNVISLKYLGQLCKFTITQIEGLQGSIVLCDQNLLESPKGKISLAENESTSLTQLSADLSSVNLSSENSGKEEWYSLSSESPVKLLSQNIKSHLASTPLRNKNCYSSATDFENSQFYYITSDTQIIIINFDKLHSEKTSTNAVTFDSIGGLCQSLDELRKIVEAFKQGQHGLHRTVPSGILLQGPSGTGKTSIAKAMANEMGSSFLTVAASHIYSKFFGETETRLKEIFEEAQNRAPSIIFIDEIDTLCPRRDTSQTDQDKRVVTTFTTLMDSINQLPLDKRVLFLAATNSANDLDPAIRRPGRLTKEIEIGVPNALDRREILLKHLHKGQHNILLDQILSIADQLHGFVGADIAELCNEARNHAVERCLLEHPKLADEECAQLVQVTLPDLRNALCRVRPSSLREVAVEIPKVHWSDIGGLNKVKRQLWEIIDLPLKFPEFFQRLGISSRGILLFGPPGCSKTMIAQALATEYGLNFLSVKGPELFSKYVGESERTVRELFKKAGNAAPSIIFFDEIESLTAERGSSSNVGNRVVSQLLTELDGLMARKEIFVAAATNRPDMIDPALLRFGRFGNLVYVPLPDEETRREIFQIWFKKLHGRSDINLDELVQLTESYSGAEIVSVCQTAGIKALSENLAAEHFEVEMKHFLQALQQVPARTSLDQIKFYEEYAQKMASNYY